MTLRTLEQKYPMIGLVTHLIGLFDPYGIKHSERVAALALRMGAALNFTPEQIEILDLAAHLHDIGKAGIPEAIRGKPGALTEAEFFLMKQHPKIGRDILTHMNGRLSPAVYAAVLHHHEDWSGTGYPDGLKAEEIPLEARIIRIADTYDALTYLRGYQPPLSHREAVELMRHDQAVRQLFDPDLFAVFLQLMDGA